MKHLRGFGIILFVSAAGEILRRFIPLPVPGGIYGLTILFVLLCMKIVKLDVIKASAGFLIEIMPVMFIPASVGLMDRAEELRAFILPLLVIVAVSTFIVLGVSGLSSQAVIRGKRNE